MPSNHPLIHVPTPVIKPEDINDDTLRYLSRDSFALWSLHMGILVDNRPLEFERHKYLLPIYADPSLEIVLVKAAQMGATVYQLLRLIWFLQQNQGTKAALYLPNKELVDNLSKDRLTPMLASCPEIYDMTDPNDKLGLRKIGASSLYLMYLEGKSSKDSVPLDYLSFDEVRLSSDQSIDQTQERLAHSDWKYRVFMSTCGYPQDSIHKRFLRGTQHVWTAHCGCSDGVDLARTFPDCVVDDPKRGLSLRCPKCKYTINDPQNGRYVPMNPGADVHSYHVSQLTSDFISLKEIWEFYKTTTNIAEFYNGKLGLPYVDEENRGVIMDQLMACVDESLDWGPAKRNEGCAMGVDQGAGYVVAVIGDIADNGKKRIRHIEIIENNNPRYMDNGKKVTPFLRLRELMKEFNVRICVVDAMPNSNDALSFAQDFRSRVFLAWYQRDAKHVVQWGDKKKSGESIRKAGSFLKFKYTVVLARYLSLGAMLGGWSDGKYICPHPDGLVQICRDTDGITTGENGATHQLMPEPVCRRLFSHMCRLIKQFKVTNEETGEGRHDWIYTGGDPHLAHAMNYLNVGLERLGQRVLYTFA